MNTLFSKETLIKNFKCYTWPNPAFPFREYFKSDKCRIFIIENMSHNYNWLKQYKDKIKDTDYFFIIQGCIYASVFYTDLKIFDLLDLNKNNFFYMCNSNDDINFIKKNNLKGDLINHNAWIDYNKFKIIPNIQKLYDAIYTARLISVKRHYLANKVKNLALIIGNDPCHSTQQLSIPPYIYRNPTHLKPEEVIQKLNESRCGLCLSDAEGACFSSSEYLLCGIPVVSTKCKGGREIWYNEHNSIICEPKEDDIAKAVQYFADNPKDGNKIRQMHIEQSLEQRQKFIKQLQIIFNKTKENINAQEYFNKNYIHKMRSSYTPNFDKIFN